MPASWAIAWDGRTVSFTIGAGDHPDPVERACRMVLSIGMSRGG